MSIAAAAAALLVCVQEASDDGWDSLLVTAPNANGLDFATAAAL